MTIVLLTLVFVAVPLLEIFVIVAVADQIGTPSTLLVLILVSAVGAWLTKREGLDAAQRVREGVRLGRLPTRDVMDAMVVLLAGVLMLTPGFVTDLVGLAFMAPPVRRVVGDQLLGVVRRRLERRFPMAGATADGNQQGRAYRRPDEPAPPGWRPPSRAANVDPDVLDVEGEEIIFGDPSGEIGPWR